MVSLDVDDTIAAIASAPGSGLRGIVRVSGPRTLALVETLFENCDLSGFPNRLRPSSTRGQIEIDEGLKVDIDLYLWPTKRSYTRQPTAEFHLIGSRPVLEMVLNKICGGGARLARPGEFTLRAFLSGRIDLTQAEAVLAVIDSSGEQQLDTALRQMAGGLAGPLGSIRDDLMGTLAELEAGLDFVEEDIEFITRPQLLKQLESAGQKLETIQKQISLRDRGTEASRVVLWGEPNSGKSSLFNALLGTQQSIVTEVAGTTTDFLVGELVLKSMKLDLVDTAGAEERSEYVSSQAQQHRIEQQEQADARLFCIDSLRETTPWEKQQLSNLTTACVVVLTKIDLHSSKSTRLTDLSQQIRDVGFDGPLVATSSESGVGLESLGEEISLAVINSQSTDQSIVGTTVLRASESLRDASAAVGHAKNAVIHQLGDELVASEIRRSLEALGQVVGAIYTDDILDLVFGRFCIGK